MRRPVTAEDSKILYGQDKNTPTAPDPKRTDLACFASIARAAA